MPSLRVGEESEMIEDGMGSVESGSPGKVFDTGEAGAVRAESCFIGYAEYMIARAAIRTHDKTVPERTSIRYLKGRGSERGRIKL